MPRPRTIVVTGDTFPVKGALRRLGGRWDASRQAWVFNLRNHPENTTRARERLDAALRVIERTGCKIERE